MGSYDKAEDVIGDAVTLGEDHLIPPAYLDAPLAGVQKAVSNTAMDIGKGVAEDYASLVTLPQRISKPNPYSPGSEEAQFYDTQNANQMREWIPKIIETMATGGMSRALGRAGTNTLGIMGGRFSAGADLDALKTAEAMHARAAPRGAIWNSTGWLREPDAQWRFEYPMYNARILDSRGKTLGHMIDLPGVYKGHPDIMTARTKFDPNLPPGEAYWLTEKYLRAPHTRETMGLPDMPTPHEELKKHVIHEVSHGLQRRNNFTSGGDLEEILPDAIKRLKMKGIPPEKEIGGKTLAEMLATEFYIRGGGEAYARAAERRLQYGPRQLAQEPPWETIRQDKWLQQMARARGRDPLDLLIWAKPGGTRPDYMSVPR
jgi:hypothetical protein